MKQYALFRYPMAPSLSPQIHAAFGQQCGIDLKYTQIAISPENFKAALDQFRDEGGQGANVTMPLKEIAFYLCDKTSNRAKVARSVNTLFWDENILCGDTTDGSGFIRALENYPLLSLHQKKIVLLGAGGAAAGIIANILDQSPSELILVNRSVQRAKDLAKRFSADIKVIEIESLDQYLNIDWVINATPINNPKDFPFNAAQMHNAVLYELAYNKSGGRTLLAEWALASGASHAIDGLGMLIAQAAESFKIWHPETDVACLKNLIIHQGF